MGLVILGTAIAIRVVFSFSSLKPMTIWDLYWGCILAATAALLDVASL